MTLSSISEIVTSFFNITDSLITYLKKSNSLLARNVIQVVKQNIFLFFSYLGGGGTGPGGQVVRWNIPTGLISLESPAGHPLVLSFSIFFFFGNWHGHSLNIILTKDLFRVSI